MKSLVAVTGMLALVAALAGCGSRNDSASTGAAAPAASSGTALAATSPLDSGPRAAEQPIDEARAEAGEKLFQSKGCSACHTFGKRMTGPDLDGVTMRRTAAWMENQILHPDVMVKQDPISHQLFAQFALQMPNQGLTADEARTVIEFLKHKNHESLEKQKGE